MSNFEQQPILALNEYQRIESLKKPEIALQESQPKETLKRPEEQLLDYIYEYFIELLPEHNLRKPELEWGERGPSYRVWQHKIFLPDTPLDGEQQIDEMIEEAIHSIVAQMPLRRDSYQAIDTHMKNGTNIALGDPKKSIQ